MLDIRLIREQPDFVKSRLATRGGDDQLKIDEVLAVDAERRKMETALQQCNADRKRLSKEIGGARGRGEDSAGLEDRVRGIGDEIAELVRQTAEAEERQRDLLLNIPNLPHADAPVGTTAAENPVVRSWGEKPQLPGPVLDHVALGAQLKLFDTGAGDEAERERIHLFHRRGRAAGAGADSVHARSAHARARLPRSESAVSRAARLHGRDDAVAEVRGGHVRPGGRRHVSRADRGSAGDESASRRDPRGLPDLPKKFTAYTPCFRREAGSAGRETRGIIRVHQFDKVELVKITAPENSYDEHEALTADAERVLQLLGLHYRVIELCTGDLGFGSAKTYDIEVWSPGQNAYLEVSSCSNFEDFQARRMNLRFKDAEGKTVSATRSMARARRCRGSSPRSSKRISNRTARSGFRRNCSPILARRRFVSAPLRRRGRAGILRASFTATASRVRRPAGP